jgi:hypothetical protein
MPTKPVGSGAGVVLRSRSMKKKLSNWLLRILLLNYNAVCTQTFTRGKTEK